MNGYREQLNQKNVPGVVVTNGKKYWRKKILDNETKGKSVYLRSRHRKYINDQRTNGSSFSSALTRILDHYPLLIQENDLLKTTAKAMNLYREELFKAQEDLKKLQEE